MKTSILAALIAVSGLTLACNAEEGQHASDDFSSGRRVASGRFHGTPFSIGGALSTGAAGKYDIVELGLELNGMVVAAETAHGAVGLGPYARLRPVPFGFAQGFFVHVAAYAGYVTTGESGYVAPWWFAAYEFGPSGRREFLGLGVEGIVFGTRF